MFICLWYMLASQYKSFGSGSLDDIPLDDNVLYTEPSNTGCFTGLFQMLMRLLPFG